MLPVQPVKYRNDTEPVHSTEEEYTGNHIWGYYLWRGNEYESHGDQRI